MAREPKQITELRRVLGARLAAFRQAAELTQGQLAIAASVDRTTVAHIERGRSRGDERFWTIADQRCRANGALLNAFHTVEAARQDHEARIHETELAEARAKAETLRTTHASAESREADEQSAPTPQEALASMVTFAGTELTEGPAAPLAFLTFLDRAADDTIPTEWVDQIQDQLTGFLRRWANTMNRRELLELLGLAAATVAASPVVSSLNFEEQERLVRAIVSPSRVDERVIDHVDAMFRHCKLQEDALGSRAVLPTALGQLALIDDLLAGCPATLRPRLLSTKADISTSIGYYFFEINNTDSARSYFEQARTAAHDAGSVELGIYALCEWSYTASWQGRAPLGLDLATVAQNLICRTQDPLMRVAAAQRAATAHAFDGKYRECMAEIEKAQDDLASAGQASPESPVYFYNEGYLASHQSECLLKLGKPREAAVSASAGLALYDKSFVDGHAVCTLHLGNAYLQSGEIEEAARVVGNAAGLAARTRSARLAKELRTTRARMQPWQGTPALTMLDDQLAAYGLASGSPPR